MPDCVAVNIRDSDYDVYIGRPGQGLSGPFGNPHPVGKICPICKIEHRRGEAVAAFERWFFSDEPAAARYRSEIDKGIKPGDRLGCFCKQPSVEVACHGDTIAEYVNAGYSLGALLLRRTARDTIDDETKKDLFEGAK